MSKVNFLFGIHNHQPVGNFGSVFDDTFKSCYQPVIDIISQYPDFKVAVHYTGPLLEWIEKHHPEFFDKLALLVEKGQVEILGGGFYEPLLSMLPEEDAVGQLEMMNNFIEKRFGVRAKGIWLAERVWDPYLPRIISKAGISYTIIDDTHFYYTGLDSKDMFGYYLTEKHGDILYIFPINKFLRYSIPFRQPEETFNYFREVHGQFNIKGITFADDGEKFGVWPGTYQWVFNEKWLERFLRGVQDNSSWLEMTLFSEFIASHPPQGKIYLPMASYEEMMEWALPSNTAVRFKNMQEELDKMGLKERYKPFIRGGLWDNFLIKYSESNWMHKRMLFVSKRLSNIVSKKAKMKYPTDLILEAKTELFKGQCNCAYWHGLFGGLYLNYLRHAIFEHLIHAENILKRITDNNGEEILVEQGDIDKDGFVEIYVANKHINIFIDPDYGGTLLELDISPKCFNLTNVLTRRIESYHDKIREVTTAPLSDSNKDNKPKSIHDTIRVKEDGLENKLIYDWYERRTFLDHFLERDTKIETFKTVNYTELGDFLNHPYHIEGVKKDKDSVKILLKREGKVRYEGKEEKILIHKDYLLSAHHGNLNVHYQIQNKSNRDLSLWFGVELNLTLLAPDDNRRYYYIPEGLRLDNNKMSSEGEFIGNSLCLRDEWFKMDIKLYTNSPAYIWRFPIETVSQSEGGFENTYQGSIILFSWQFELKRDANKLADMYIEVAPKC